MADEEEQKIIIDEDWKAQVQREREAARQAADESKPATAAEGDAGAGDAAVDKEAAEDEGNLFLGLVHSLGSQCMYALGLLAPRDAKEVYIDLEQARYVIDMLMVLRDKTEGNLTPTEKGRLTEVLSELQQIYVMRSQQVQEQELGGLNARKSPKGR